VTEFAVWAPDRNRVSVLVGEQRIALDPAPGGWWHTDQPDHGHGTDYAFLLDDDATPLPDPRSRWQPKGVHERSRVYDHDAFWWTDDTWTGRALAGSVLYECHIGTFTDGGTFDSAIGRLDHLVSLGIDLVEVLPVNAVDGPVNWGYDGVGWYAVTENYGGPDAFKRFVDACHARGLGVVLDVVYNHLGPSGAYLDRFGAVLRRLQHLGPVAEPRRRGLRRGPPLHDRQRADVAARLPRRRAAHRRRPRAARHPGPSTCWSSSPSR
jgi:maltooligosyltrehalose trehalohydrolase